MSKRRVLWTCFIICLNDRVIGHRRSQLSDERHIGPLDCHEWISTCANCGPLTSSTHNQTSFSVVYLIGFNHVLSFTRTGLLVPSKISFPLRTPRTWQGFKAQQSMEGSNDPTAPPNSQVRIPSVSLKAMQYWVLVWRCCIGKGAPTLPILTIW